MPNAISTHDDFLDWKDDLRRIFARSEKERFAVETIETFLDSDLEVTETVQALAAVEWICKHRGVVKASSFDSAREGLMLALSEATELYELLEDGGCLHDLEPYQALAQRI